MKRYVYILHNKKTGDLQILSLTNDQADFFEMLATEDLIEGLEFDYDLVDLRDMKHWIPYTFRRGKKLSDLFYKLKRNEFHLKKLFQISK